MAACQSIHEVHPSHAVLLTGLTNDSKMLTEVHPSKEALIFTKNHKGIHDSNGGASLTQIKLSGSNNATMWRHAIVFPSHAHEVTVSQHRFDVHHFRLRDLHKMFHAVASVHGP